MKKIEIAILGANSHIAKGLTSRFLAQGQYDLHLHTTSPEKTKGFLSSLGKSCEIHVGYEEPMPDSYDVVINCIGVGSAPKLKGRFSNYFTVTEKYDNLCIEYLLNKNSKALYIDFSSGAVYGRTLAASAMKETAISISPNNISSADYYSIARLNSEAKHRSFKDLNIVDLRVFSYFSRYMDIEDGYFVNQIMDCILTNKTLLTDEANIVRDYIHPEDLFSLAIKCIEAGKINAVFDAVSSKPVDKKEILDFFSSEYGLKYETKPAIDCVSSTGFKNIYCSAFNAAASIGYEPKYTALEALKMEAEIILGKTKK